jgi:hypothetical protein
MRPASALVLLGVAVLVAVGLFWTGGFGGGGSTATVARATTVTATIGGRTTVTVDGAGRIAPTERSLQAKARLVLGSVDATGQAPKGYVGGRPFMNDARGGTASLPRRAPDGRSINYHEYDVNPYRQGVNRGPQRLVVGFDGSAFYTGDHYVTWTRLR